MFIGTSQCGVGKDWAGTFFPPPKCVDLSIYLSVFWIMYLNSFDLYQAENIVFKPNSLLVLLLGRPPKCINLSILSFIVSIMLLLSEHL